MIVLGIETSCDDTGVGLYDGKAGKLLGHTIHTQTSHDIYGGVVPELASRDHIRKLAPLLEKLLEETKFALHNIDAVAYTTGPGLAGALLVGASFAKTLSYSINKSSVAVNHIEGHLLAPMLEVKYPSFPYLALLVSGGHTSLIRVNDIGDYDILGETLDDAAGEAFDKTAKLLGLGYPGGKILANHASNGLPGKFKFPRPLVNRPNLDFSFSGLKTHVLNTVNLLKESAVLEPGDYNNNLDMQIIKDICYEFEEAVTDTLTIKCRKAIQMTNLEHLIVTGGVGANLKLRAKIKALGEELGIEVYFPRQEFCTDNGAMIAYAGFAKLKTDFDRFVDKDFAINACPRLKIGT